MHAIRELYHAPFYPDAVVRERAFVSKNRPGARRTSDAGGLEVERAGGWVEAACKIAWPDATQHRYMASEWRSKVFGHRKGDTDYWKATCFTWATADTDLITDHHQADARGLLAACGMDIIEKGGNPIHAEIKLRLPRQ